MTNPNDSKTTSDPMDHYQGYGIIFVMLFIVFMVIALVGQLFVLNWRSWLPGAEESMTTLDGVRTSVYTVISQVS
jgi:Na+-transporting methylmalonyl-CoA/oxaloacetate decarboxylase gamma subunit